MHGWQAEERVSVIAENERLGSWICWKLIQMNNQKNGFAHVPNLEIWFGRTGVSC